jgi:hypothetical protein
MSHCRDSIVTSYASWTVNGQTPDMVYFAAQPQPRAA